MQKINVNVNVNVNDNEDDNVNTICNTHMLNINIVSEAWFMGMMGHYRCWRKTGKGSF